MNLLQASSAHLMVAFFIRQDLKVRLCFSSALPHRTQLVSMTLLVGSSSITAEAESPPSEDGPGLSSISPAKSKSRRHRYNWLFLNLLWCLHGVGRGRRTISFTGTRQLHHGEYSSSSSRCKSAAEITAAKRANLYTTPNIFSRFFSNEKTVNRWR